MVRRVVELALERSSLRCRATCDMTLLSSSSPSSSPPFDDCCSGVLEGFTIVAIVAIAGGVLEGFAIVAIVAIAREVLEGFAIVAIAGGVMEGFAIIAIVAIAGEVLEGFAVVALAGGELHGSSRKGDMTNLSQSVSSFEETALTRKHHRTSCKLNVLSLRSMQTALMLLTAPQFVSVRW